MAQVTPPLEVGKVMHVIVQLIDKKSMGVKDVEQLDMAIRAHAMLYKVAWPSSCVPSCDFLAHLSSRSSLRTGAPLLVLRLRAQEHGCQARC